jgi:phosphomannomutase
VFYRELLLKQGMHYLYVAKPDDHTYMMDWIAAYEELPHCDYKDEKGRTHSYRIQKFAMIKSQAIIAQGKKEPSTLLTQLGFADVAIKSVDETDGLRMILTDERIIHLRPSGNAPELRCYAEAETYLIANQYAVRVLNNIQTL